MENSEDIYIEIVSSLKDINVEPEKIKLLIYKIPVQIFKAMKEKALFTKQYVSAKLKDGEDGDLSTDDEEKEREDEKDRKRKENESEKMKKRRARKTWRNELPLDESESESEREERKMIISQDPWAEILPLKKRKRVTDSDWMVAKKKKFVDLMVKKAIFLPFDFIFTILDISPRDTQLKLFTRLRNLNKSTLEGFNRIALESLKSTDKLIGDKDYRGLYHLSRTLAFRLNTFLPRWETTDGYLGLFPLISRFIGKVKVTEGGREEWVRRNWFLGALMVVPYEEVFGRFSVQENSFLRKIGLSRSKFIEDFKLEKGNDSKDIFLKQYFHNLIKQNIEFITKGIKDLDQIFTLRDLNGEVKLTRTQVLYFIFRAPISFNLDFKYLIGGPNDLHNNKLEFDFDSKYYRDYTLNVSIDSNDYTKFSNNGGNKEQLDLVTHILLKSDLELKNLSDRKIKISGDYIHNLNGKSILVKNCNNISLNYMCSFKISYIDTCEKCTFTQYREGEFKVSNTKKSSIHMKGNSKIKIERSNTMYLTLRNSEVSLDNSRNIFWESTTTNIDFKNIKESQALGVLFSIKEPTDEDFVRLKRIFISTRENGEVEIYWNKFSKENAPRMLRRKYPNEIDFMNIVESYGL